MRAHEYVPAAPAAEQDTANESAPGMEARADQTPTGAPTVTANAARLAKVLGRAREGRVGRRWERGGQGRAGRGRSVKRGLLLKR